MAKFWCKVCGAQMHVADGVLVETCSVCGARQALPHAVDDEYIKHVAELNRMRQNGEYQASAVLADALIQREPTDGVLYWQRLLIQYEAVYRLEQGKFRYALECRKPNPQPVMEHEDYLRVRRYASVAQRAIYEEDAKLLERARREVCGESYVPDESVSPLNGGFLCLEDGEWKAAAECFDRVLQAEPENGLAYFGKMMSELHVRRESELVHVGKQIPETENYNFVMEYGDDSLRSRVNLYWERAALIDAVEECENAVTVDDWKRIKKMLQQLPDSDQVQQNIFLCDKKIREIMVQNAEVIFGCREAASMGITTETLGVRVVNAKYYYDSEATDFSYGPKKKFGVDRHFTIAVISAVLCFLIAMGLLLLLLRNETKPQQLPPEVSPTVTTLPDPTEQSDAVLSQHEIEEPELCVVGKRLFLLQNGSVTCLYGISDEDDGETSGSTFAGNFSPYASDFSTWKEITALYSDPTGQMLFGVRRDGMVVYDIFAASSMRYEELYHSVVSWRDVKLLTMDRPDEMHAYLFGVTKSGSLLVSDPQLEEAMQKTLGKRLESKKLINAKAASGRIYLLFEDGEYSCVEYGE